MLTPAELTTLQYLAHAFEAADLDGFVRVPQTTIARWEAELLRLRAFVEPTP